MSSIPITEWLWPGQFFGQTFWNVYEHEHGSRKFLYFCMTTLFISDIVNTRAEVSPPFNAKLCEISDKCGKFCKISSNCCSPTYDEESFTQPSSFQRPQICPDIVFFAIRFCNCISAIFLPLHYNFSSQLTANLSFSISNWTGFTTDHKIRNLFYVYQFTPISEQIEDKDMTKTCFAKIFKLNLSRVLLSVLTIWKRQNLVCQQLNYFPSILSIQDTVTSYLLLEELCFNTHFMSILISQNYRVSAPFW